MSLNRRAASRDKNEKALILALKDVGCLVVQLDKFDLLVLRAGQVYMVEIKNPDGRDRLTPFQKELLAEGWPLHIVRTPEEALRAVGLQLP